MNVTDCLLVGLDANSRAIAQEAVRHVFPQAVFTSLSTVAEALQRKNGLGGELLLVKNPDEASLTQIISATDAANLRRWAIVVLGSAPSGPGVEVVSHPEPGEFFMAHVCRSAVVQHQLVRLQQRTQGDLQTVAHRIAHDLRTPLGGIISAGEVVKETIADYDPGAVSLVTPIFNSTEEVSRLIERVSYVLKASASPVVKKRLAMMEPVWAAVQRLERQFAKKGASVTQSDSWPEVSGVGRMLEISWWNLLTNALQHAGESPQIKLGWSEEANGYKFWVGDNGPGIPTMTQAKLFQPFNTLYETNASRGLGLSIVQRLIGLQGGHCGYQPIAGGGSQFFFTLPNT